MLTKRKELTYMKYLGLDIGTTNISAVVLNDGTVIDFLTKMNNSRIYTQTQPWEVLQHPRTIRSLAFDIVTTLIARHPDIARIGVTGQMHGILYLNEYGDPLSPLYTWQDGRGNQIHRGNETYASYLSRMTGYSLATGYGMVTHFYNMKNGLVPPGAKVFCTIHDYIAMALAGASGPVVDASDAASFGIFDCKNGTYDTKELSKMGFDLSLLPKLAKKPCLGYYFDKIPVYTAIGDNQASFLGATSGNHNAMLLNVGTGSQFSVYSKEFLSCPGLETRPFPGGGYLIVGAALCGGRAYAMLEQFFSSITESVTGTRPASCYDAMEKLIQTAKKPGDLPQIDPKFQGTRQNPTCRASITDLSVTNFTPLHFIWAMSEGIIRELYDMYALYRNAGGKDAPLYGSGNGLRKNKAMQQCAYDLFHRTLQLSSCQEEAAVGAAMYAADC